MSARYVVLIWSFSCKHKIRKFTYRNMEIQWINMIRMCIVYPLAIEWTFYQGRNKFVLFQYDKKRWYHVILLLLRKFQLLFSSVVCKFTQKILLTHLSDKIFSVVCVCVTLACCVHKTKDAISFNIIFYMSLTDLFWVYVWFNTRKKVHNFNTDMDQQKLILMQSLNNSKNNLDKKLIYSKRNESSKGSSRTLKYEHFEHAHTHIRSIQATKKK